MQQAVHAYRTPDGWRTDIDYWIHLEPTEKRIRARFNGEIIVDSGRAVILREKGHLPVYYFPRDDVRMDLAARTNHSTHCPHKGDASYWTLRVKGKDAENALWAYENPDEHLAALDGLVALYWNKMGHWFEEDEEVFVHPRDPRKRIDILVSHRPVKVVVGGTKVAETTNARFLFETDLPTRYYIPREDMRMDLFTPSATRTQCPYKGEAAYWSAEIGGETYADIVWSYPNPVPEARAIAELFCFYNENVDAIFLDGKELQKPKTKWSRQ